MIDLTQPKTLTWEQGRAFVMRYRSGEPDHWVIAAVLDAYATGYQGATSRKGKEEPDVEKDEGVPVLSDFWRPSPTAAYWLGTIISSIGWVAWIAFAPH